jgi:hypothetical protein
MSLTDYKIEPGDYIGQDIMGLPDQVVGDAAALKARFDALVKQVLVPKINGLIDDLGTDLGGITDDINALAIQSGGDGNSWWIKYPDGTMIQNKRVAWGPTLIATSLGNIYVHSASSINLGTFGQPWVTTSIQPMVTVTVRNSGGGPMVWPIMQYSAGNNIGSVMIAAALATSNSYSGTIEACGIGRWK